MVLLFSVRDETSEISLPFARLPSSSLSTENNIHETEFQMVSAIASCVGLLILENPLALFSVHRNPFLPTNGKHPEIQTSAKGLLFCCHLSSKPTSQETEVHFSQVKRSHLSVVIGRFRTILFAFAFQGSLAVTITVIDSSEKRFHWLGFELQSPHVIERCNKEV